MDFFIWSGVRESNPPQRLGKPLYYRCTNPAYMSDFIIVIPDVGFKRNLTAYKKPPLLGGFSVI